MCTIGAVATTDPRGNPVAFAHKTCDYMPHSNWHGCSMGGLGHDLMGFNGLSRPGVNSGMNAKGLAVMRSFLDYRGPFDENEEGGRPKPDFPLDMDNRSAIGAHVLEQFDNVEDGLSYAMEILPKYTGKGSGQRGGNFLLADAEGKIALIEHCEDRIASKYYPEGYAARGNNGFLILKDEQAGLPQAVRQDREVRCDRMRETVREIHDSVPRGMSKDDALNLLKETLSWKGPKGDGGIGAICAVDLRVPGARTNSGAPCSTFTGVIFDLIDKVMHFTRGNPSENPWHTMTFSS